jgi:VanZ family protein
MHPSTVVMSAFCAASPDMTALPTLPALPRLRRFCHASALLMYAAIIVAGSIPGARADIGQYATGLVLHSAAYAILAALWFLGSTGGPAMRALKAVAAIALMGAGDEFVQSFFPYRGADVRDWAVDCAAAIVTSAVLYATSLMWLMLNPSQLERR